MYRISPSKLDTFRIYKNEVFEMTKEGLIERLTAKTETTEAMQFGKDVHEFIETGVVKDLYPEEIDQLIPFREQWIQEQKELWVEMEISESAFMLMRVDMIHGNTVSDLKVAGRFWGVDYYEQSLQWKSYLTATGASKFTYRIFQKRGTKRPIKFEYHEFDFYPYKGMEDEVMAVSDEFIRFCEDNGITESITQKQHK